MKKLILGIAGFLTVLALMPMFAAFEAHVVNVTATIENALSLPIADPIKFGTVFPQEKLEEHLRINLSNSFLDPNQTRVDTVNYFIRQKPKCALSWWIGGKNYIDESSTKTGHVISGDNLETQIVEEYWIDCGERPVTINTEVPVDAIWDVLPNLCPYISKHPMGANGDDDSVNDGSLNSFHHPFAVNASGSVVWTDVPGTLNKIPGPNSVYDPQDKWIIDLAVPCFGGYCAQDWENFVHSINAEANPAEFTQPIENEHKVFGCDLWVEVSGVYKADEVLIP